MPACPHDDVQFCPLYVAMHVPGVPSCDDGRVGDGRCAVARGLVYRAAVERLRVKVPGLVEGCEWRQQLLELKLQRDRNLRLNGIH